MCYRMIIDQLIEKVNPELIYFQDLEKIHLFLVVWDANRSSFHKRLHIRRVFDSANYAFKTPYDITVLTSQELELAIEKNDVFVTGILDEGELLYHKEKFKNIDVM